MNQWLDNEESFLGVTLDGRYRVQSELGRGGMAAVYLAIDDRFDRPVVVKIPHDHVSEIEGFHERFQLEIQSLIKLDHPNIVKIHDTGDHEGRPYAVLQYLSGGSLSDRLRTVPGVQEPRSVAVWLTYLAKTLDFIHQRGVIHRDVKPGNILYDAAGNVFLSDFGITRAVTTEGTSLTATGFTPGTPDYMAPEQGLDETLTGATDQYSLAASAYRVLAGRPTHEGATPIAILASKHLNPAAPLHEVLPGVIDRRLSAAVMRALARNPVERYPTCLEFARQFRLALQRPKSARPAAVPARPAEPRSPPRPEPGPAREREERPASKERPAEESTQPTVAAEPRHRKSILDGAMLAGAIRPLARGSALALLGVLLALLWIAWDGTPTATPPRWQQLLQDAVAAASAEDHARARQLVHQALDADPGATWIDVRATEGLPPAVVEAVLRERESAPR